MRLSTTMRSARTLSAPLVLIVGLGCAERADASIWNIGYDVDGDSVMGVGCVLLSLANAGTGIAEAVTISRGRGSTGLAVASFVLGSVGINAGVLVVALDHHYSDVSRGLGVATIVVSGLNLALAAVQLGRPARDERPRLTLTPLTFADAGGQLSAGAGVVGRF